MNKVLKSLVVGGLGLMMLPGMVKADVEGEVLNAAGSSSANAYVNSIDESDTFHVSIYWGDLQYDYVKQTDSAYAWVPVTEESNYIIVDNYSTFAINADVSWNATIEGTTATFEGNIIDYDNYVCQSSYYTTQPYNWNGDGWDEFGNAISNKYALGDETTPIYTDGECTTVVAEGTEFAEGTYYGYAPAETAFSGSSISLEPMRSADWDMWIVGGEKSAVEEALAGDKVIGSVTVTISEALGDEG